MRDALVDQAATDPVVRALLELDAAGFTTESESRPVYRVWRRHILELLTADLGPAQATAPSTHAHIAEIVDVIVDALAGFTTPRGVPNASSTRLDHVHLLLTAVLPGLCTSADHTHRLQQSCSVFAGRTAPASVMPRAQVLPPTWTLSSNP
ncbi:hypothetical protein HQ346_23930 [Rhodococcus sp. BP-252]|uniref:hypothetical protein n=1 Tax=unclassified Rhodococcus (in: high G+C Gram-positive bacteria) TaxID=192944 RepID=UPI001C9B9C37|nr:MULTISPECIES: hypothetical protein [unclassified Rhodococcus (in: high G+C Gram-positive bacteria)]MBY6414669.1 hypothetical protein [Rhodococcus sp. BP-320]MBY6419494.1 hypothetical protein [Rhodococcus sp. BP-321]MBY6424494.1 hypothetical protein [Rhodococcus sp. BP-324]MBY6429505.1 hypothetical protein [Rhodococcus sp. BP-323]MBY6434504.1 hypothetical protein [Rhodococcus sp. BP-322]